MNSSKDMGKLVKHFFFLLAPFFVVAHSSTSNSVRYLYVQDLYVFLCLPSAWCIYVHISLYVQYTDENCITGSSLGTHVSFCRLISDCLHWGTVWGAVCYYCCQLEAFLLIVCLHNLSFPAGRKVGKFHMIGEVKDLIITAIGFQAYM